MTEKRLYHAVADQIKKLISDGAFPPGSRLPGERDLAERFDVFARRADLYIDRSHPMVRTYTPEDVASPVEASIRYIREKLAI